MADDDPKEELLRPRRTPPRGLGGKRARPAPARPEMALETDRARTVALFPGVAPPGVAAREHSSIRPGSVRPIAGQEPANPPGRVRRVRRPDLIAQLPLAVAVLAWGATALAIMFYDNSRPRSTGLDRFFGPHRTADSEAAVDVAAGCAVAVLLLSVLGLWINSRRMKREEDRYSRSLILLLGLSLLALLAYVVW